MAIDEENFKVLIGFRFIDDIVSENLDKLQSAGRYIQRLVDDVFTTGSTVYACFRALREIFSPDVRISVACLCFVG